MNLYSIHLLGMMVLKVELKSMNSILTCVTWHSRWVSAAWRDVLMLTCCPSIQTGFTPEWLSVKIRCGLAPAFQSTYSQWVWEPQVMWPLGADRHNGVGVTSHCHSARTRLRIVHGDSERLRSSRSWLLPRTNISCANTKCCVVIGCLCCCAAPFQSRWLSFTVAIDSIYSLCIMGSPPWNDCEASACSLYLWWLSSGWTWQREGRHPWSSWIVWEVSHVLNSDTVI